MVSFNFTPDPLWLPWQRNLEQLVGYNSACVTDICEIFASILGFSGIGHRMMCTYVRDISEILASNRGFLSVEQISNFSKFTMVDSRCLGNKFLPKIG